jgi:SET and MYND domain-containing protein
MWGTGKWPTGTGSASGLHCHWQWYGSGTPDNIYSFVGNCPMESLIPKLFPDLRVEVRPGRGRCLVAARDIAAGCAVLVSNANAVFSSTDAVCHSCWRAALPGAVLLRCTTCKTSYCNAKCQKQDWKPFHRLECRLLLAFKHKESQVPAYLWVPLLLAARLYRGQTVGDDGDANVEGPTLAHFQSLSVLAPAEDPSSRAYARAKTIVALARELNLFPSTEILSDERAIRDQLIFDVNNFTLTDETLNSTGYGAYAFSALTNHSCAPNVVLSYGFSLGEGGSDNDVEGVTTINMKRNPTTQIVRTLLPLKEGEELVHSYVDVTHAVQERQSELLSSYAINCECSACVKELAEIAAAAAVEVAATAVATQQNIDSTVDVTRANLMVTRAR